MLEEVEQISSSGDARTQLKSILDAVANWIQILPDVKSLPASNGDRTSDVNLTPLERCFARELFKGKGVLQIVRNELSLVR